MVFYTPTDVFMLRRGSWTNPGTAGWTFAGRGKYFSQAKYDMEMYHKYFPAGEHYLNPTQAMYVFLHAGMPCPCPWDRVVPGRKHAWR